MPRLPTESFAPALFVSWTSACPRCDMLVGCKACHIHPNLCNDTGRCRFFDPYHALYQGHRFFQRVPILLHFLFSLAQRLFQKIDGSENASEQPLVMGTHTPIQSLAQFW